MRNQIGSSGPALNIQEDIELALIQHADVNVEVGGVPDTIEILLDCEAKGQKLSDQLHRFSPSIYMVPSNIRDLSPRSYQPRVVSIGPLHRKDKTLQEFEAQKDTYLHHLLKSLNVHLNNVQSKEILDKCLREVNASIPKIRARYGETVITYTDTELAKMMVMDACFILEFVFPSKEHNDLISKNLILWYSICHDLLLLENQIPFFVLQDIFNCTISMIHAYPLTSGVLERFQFVIPFKGITQNNDVTEPHHILGLLQKSFYPKDKTENTYSTRPSSTMRKHSALDLDKAGVKFKPNEDGKWPMAIDFGSSWFEYFCCCGGNRTLRMPVLHIHDHTEQFLRNVIAYEQCTWGVPNYVTSYACAIDFLVDTTVDLSKLIKSKVVTNDLGSNEDAINMINNIGKGVIFKEFYYGAQWKQLDDYCDGCWPRNIAWLKGKYFNSPWNAIALLAGIILFALTIIQTIYTVKGVKDK